MVDYENTEFKIKNVSKEAMIDGKIIYYALNKDQMNELSGLLMKKIMIEFNEMVEDFAKKNRNDLEKTLGK